MLIIWLMTAFGVTNNDDVKAIGDCLYNMTATNNVSRCLLQLPIIAGQGRNKSYWYHLTNYKS